MLLLMVMGCVLFSSDAYSQTANCGNAVGRWEFNVSGRDCMGYEEEGNFIMTIDADCTLGIDILSNIPYAGDFLVTHKSLTVLKDRFAATVDFTVDQCSILELKGKIIGGKRIEGTYRYRDGGDGTFKAIRIAGKK